MKAWREMKNMTLQDLANKVGTSRQYISSIEKGHKNVGPKQAQKIAKALGLPPKIMIEIALNDLLDREGIKLKVKVA